MGTQENKASARRFLEEVINRGNVSVIDELSSPNVVDHSAKRVKDRDIAPALAS